jgi:broad specificity phosphatase PhoE
MELLLIRHALPVRRELPAGPADPELSEAGLRQAEHLADYLSSERLDAVYTSRSRERRASMRRSSTGSPSGIATRASTSRWRS